MARWRRSSTVDSVRRAALRSSLVAVALLVGACTAPPSETEPPTPSPSVSATGTASPSTAPSPSADEGLDLPAAERPFDPDALLAAMRTSQRPGGVPDQLETQSIAAALAERIWTFGGATWATFAAGGSCGPVSCTFEIGGTPEGAQGEDLYIFSVVPSSGEVELVDATLRGIPADLVADLDALTRELFADGDLTGLSLAGVRWLPPPDDGQFELSYRSGGEEGSCGVDIVVDAETPRIVAATPLDC